MKKLLLYGFIILNTIYTIAQEDVNIGTTYDFNLQRKNNGGDAWILHNAIHAENTSDISLLKWETTHPSFGSRGIRFSYSSTRGIYFYADEKPTTAGNTFTPTTRMFISNNGKVGIGNETPDARLNIQHASNSEWASTIYNLGGQGKGLLVRAANPSSVGIPIFQVEDWPGNVRLKVQVDGRVGIGTSNPLYGKVQINQTTNGHDQGLAVFDGEKTLRMFLNQGVSHIYAGQYGSNKLLINNTGNVGIGSITENALFNINLLNNTKWSTRIYNGGGLGKGLLVCAGNSSNIDATIMQLEDGNDNIRLKVRSDGKVILGGVNPLENYLLTVGGGIASREIKVDINAGADFVFANDYPILPLEEVEAFVKKNKHLPEIAPAAEMEANGLELGEMNIKLLQKVEELTLYVIDQNKKNKEQAEQLKEQGEKLKEQEAKIKALEAENQTLKEMQSAIEDIQKQLEGLKK